ncbi:hypothetical protein Bealeia2_02055 (plasmid) [Candidatus Bealeia paramacronuclearis]|uniref:hypothetical protein n=1 Tax=Candidatus Bealeia paramacronuclearis TaxID=1921001 RepID=UPI002BB58075|nr:hypothetical protein [Candidatus Bealeia paramacronuclearis]
MKLSPKHIAALGWFAALAGCAHQPECVQIISHEEHQTLKGTEHHKVTKSSVLVTKNTYNLLNQNIFGDTDKCHCR